MLRLLLCVPAVAITVTAVAGEVARPLAVERVRPSAQFASASRDVFTKGVADASGQSIERSPDGLYRVEGIVNGKKVDFIVDTGSSVVVLTPADAHRVGLAQRDAPRVDVETANGATSMRMTTIGELRLGTRSMSSVEAAIVDGGLSTSLLGQSALSRIESLTLRGGKLSLDVRQPTR